MCPKSKSKSKSINILLTASFLLVNGQAFALDEATADSARVINNAKAPPIKTVTNFTQALRCMDELFLAFDKRGIVITSGGIPDETGKVRTGTKEMLITAIAKMNLKSNAFDFIDLHSTQDDLGALFQLKGGTPTKIPDYYIRGSITQMDDNAVKKNKGWGISLPFLDFGSSKDKSFDLVSMDLSIGEAASRRILPETSTSNTMLIMKSGSSMEGGGRLGNLGLSFNLDLSQTEGLGAATRTLLELGVIEVLGKFTRVPYWKCLDVESTHPLMMDQAREWFEIAKESDRILFVQRKLAGMNRFTGDLDGLHSDALKGAIAEYQAAVGLIADGRINFDLYYSLLDNVQNRLADLPSIPIKREVPPTPSIAVHTPPPPTTAEPLETPRAKTGSTFQLNLTSERGAKPSYRIGEYLNISMGATGIGTAYCYYEDTQGGVARIFPNQFYPNSMVSPAQTIRLPSGGFKIKFDRPGRELVACIAADRELITPKNLVGTRDLTPLPVKSVQDVLGQFKQHNPAAITSMVEITVQ